MRFGLLILLAQGVGLSRATALLMIAAHFG